MDSARLHVLFRRIDMRMVLLVFYFEGGFHFESLAFLEAHQPHGALAPARLLSVFEHHSRETGSPIQLVRLSQSLDCVHFPHPNISSHKRLMLGSYL